MPLEEFWHGDPLCFTAYLKAHDMKEKRNSYERDALSWNIGTYVHDVAIEYATASNSRTETVRFPSMPRSHQENTKKKLSEEDKLRQDELKFAALASAFNNARKGR